MNQVKGTGQARIFKSSTLEFFTKTSPAITIAVYVPIISALIYWYATRFNPSLMNAVLWFAGGFVFWTLFEYIMHRFIFHFITDSPFVKRFHYLVHGVHHEYPRDHERLFMPPVPGLIILTVIFTLFYVILGKYTFIFLPGLMLGYLTYAFMHYSMHKYRPPRALRFLWTHHNLHHFKHSDKAYGVSSPFWDYIFGTMPPKDKP